MSRPRDVIEKELAAVNREADLAQQKLDRLENEVAQLEDELAALPPDNGDDELWYARRDPRQMTLELPSVRRRIAEVAN